MPGTSLSRLKGSRKRLHGPRAAIVCGYGAHEQGILTAMMERWRFGDMHVVFAGAQESRMRVGDILALPPLTGTGQDSPLPRAVILSGITEKELNTFMAAWRHLALPGQHWAVLTPTSETWSLAELLAELERERRALSL